MNKIIIEKEGRRMGRKEVIRLLEIMGFRYRKNPTKIMGRSVKTWSMPLVDFKPIEGDEDNEDST
jgi:hypothetical protein